MSPESPGAVGPAVSLMPTTTKVRDGTRMEVGGVALSSIAEEFGTPAYVVDVETLRQRARRIRDGLSERWERSAVLFASKSFPALVMYQIAASEGLCIDVAGDGELRLALAAGVDPSTIFFHGNAKTEAELRLAMDARVGTIVIDNEDELHRIEKLVDHPQDVMVRMIPDVDAPTVPSNATGGHFSKFGLPIETALRVLRDIEAVPLLRAVGVHVHIGSQILDLSSFDEAVRSVARIGHQIAYNVGGGLGVRYTPDQPEPAVEDYLDRITSVARAALPEDARLVIEPGRWLVAPSCVTLYRVVSVKRTGRAFVAIDGGMADNLAVALSDRHQTALIDTKMGRPSDGTYVVVGRQCESGDVLIDAIDLPAPEVDDLLVVPVTGAYSYTLANNYNGAYIPPVVCVEDGRAHLAARRQTFDDVVALQRLL
ncbi:MAG: diaminopimelate decarboxylase [Acidimicrobiales bacterium]